MGEYVAFLDADDIWSRNKLSEQVEILQDNSDVSLVISPYVIFSDVNKVQHLRLVIQNSPKSCSIAGLKCVDMVRELSQLV